MKRFITAFYRVERHNLDYYRRFRFETWDLVVLAINTVRLRERGKDQHGFANSGVYLSKLERIVQELDREAQSGGPPTVLAVVLHHHLMAVSRLVDLDDSRDPSITIDAREIMEMCQAHGVDVLLHGHQHQPLVATYTLAQFVSRANKYVWPRDLRSPLIIGMGTSGVPVAPYSTCGLYTYREGSLSIELIGYTTDLVASMLDGLTWPIRRFSRQLTMPLA
jgi:3',5'-cyclic AMP phosphodiesterase CpdA